MGKIFIVSGVVVAILALGFTLRPTQEKPPVQNPGELTVTLNKQASPLSGVVTFHITIKPAASRGFVPSTLSLMADDREYPGSFPTFGTAAEEDLVRTPEVLEFPFDTCRFGNGTHKAWATVQMAKHGMADAGVPPLPPDYVTSPPLEFTVDNTITRFYVLADSGGRKPHMKTSVSAVLTAPAEWRIDVLRSSGDSLRKLSFEIIRTHKGSGDSVAWSWDGRASSGNLVSDRLARPKWQPVNDGFVTRYFFRITASRNGKVIQQTAPYQEGDPSDGNPQTRL